MSDVPHGPHRPHRFDERKYEELWQPVFFSATAYRRLPILTRSGVPKTLRAALIESAEVHRCAVIAYCIMPDHLHYLTCVIAEGGNVRRMADWLKRVSGFRLGELGLPTPVWQRSFWDRHARANQSVAMAVGYIMNNPVVAGLCRRPEDWPYSEFLGCPWEQRNREENDRRI